MFLLEAIIEVELAGAEWVRVWPGGAPADSLLRVP